MHQQAISMPLFHRLMNFDFLGEHVHLQTGIPVYCNQMPPKIVDFRFDRSLRVSGYQSLMSMDAADCMTTLA